MSRRSPQLHLARHALQTAGLSAKAARKDAVIKTPSLRASLPMPAGTKSTPSSLKATPKLSTKFTKVVGASPPQRFQRSLNSPPRPRKAK